MGHIWRIAGPIFHQCSLHFKSLMTSEPEFTKHLKAKIIYHKYLTKRVINKLPSLSFKKLGNHAIKRRIFCNFFTSCRHVRDWQLAEHIKFLFNLGIVSEYGEFLGNITFLFKLFRNITFLFFGNITYFILFKYNILIKLFLNLTFF